jgi:hypothetical protein
MKWFEGLRTWSVVVVLLIGGFILTGMGKLDKEILIAILGLVNGFIVGKAALSSPTNGKAEPPK